jgi:hypothetical protein
MKTILSVTRHGVSFLYFFLPIYVFAVAPSDTLIIQPFAMPPAPIVPIDSSKTTPKKTCEFLFGTEYIDQVYYLGRNYGVSQASVASSVSVKHPIGLWIAHTQYYMSSIGYTNQRLTWFQNKNLKWAAHELILPVMYRQNLKWRQKDIGTFVVTPTWHGVWAVNPFNEDGARMRPFGYCTANFKYIIRY